MLSQANERLMELRAGRQPNAGGLIIAARQGQAVPLTPDSGYFWFFNAANIEAVVKVLNACSVNDHHWVFAAGYSAGSVLSCTATFLAPRVLPRRGL